MIENLSLFYESIKKAVGGAASVDALSDEALAALLTSSLTVDAFVGIIDPLRPDVPDSVKAELLAVTPQTYTGRCFVPK